MTAEVVAIPLEMLAAARTDTPDGFVAFYTMLHNRALPRHAEAWIDSIYAARDKGRGVVIEAFRGSTKSTTINTFERRQRKDGGNVQTATHE